MLYYQLGWFYQKSGKFTEAEGVFKKAVSLDSIVPWPYRHLGEFYYDTKRFSEAEEEFKKAISLDSTLIEAYYSLAVCRRRT